VIFRYMPPIWDATFRPRFYERWGRENAVISAHTRRAEYGEYRQLLSVKAAWGGAEAYFVDGQRIAVDDDTFLILNTGRRYASAVESCEPVHSFSIFFRPGLMEDVRRGVVSRTEDLLDSPQERATPPIEFAEHLREHDRLVTPVLRHIQRAVDGGTTDELWVEEQLHFLAQRLLRLHMHDIERRMRAAARRPAVRKELERRLGRAVNFMNTHYSSPLGLDEIAGAARLSPHHFLRAFKAAHGLTPSAYLNRKRVRAARRLMQDSTWSLTRIACHVGFGSRTTLYRQLKLTDALRARD
jgi:AraC-like DNA-binding protein